MQYQSTRGKETLVESAYAIKTGLAEDGGLFVPVSKPTVSLDEIGLLSTMTYKERAVQILKLYLTDFTEEEIASCVERAYNKEKFETVDIAPLYQLDKTSYFLELWHGPTCAFKDMALQILPHLLTTSVRKTGEMREVVILVATSGDTGKAALEGFRDVRGTRIIVFYPEHGVSEIQRRQMVTQEGNNVDVAAVVGNFDDAQTGVKRIFTDERYRAILANNNFLLSSANSINWGRLVPQIIYYFSAYCNLVKNDQIKLGDRINFVVPTGNFGNILAAYYAKEMGLPIAKLICASNENNVLTEFINTGVYNREREFHTTTSPSMDILISSNLERFLFDVTGGDHARVRDWMQQLAETGRYEVPDITKSKIKEIFWGGCCNDAQTAESIRSVYEEYGYVIDPHTAVAKNVYDQYVAETGDETKTVIVSTASPFKFNGSVLRAIQGEAFDSSLDEFAMLHALAETTGLDMPQSLASLASKPVVFGTTCEKDEMIDVVSGMLGLV